jgi:DNA-binding NarL/FixJ family response regulator
VLNAVGATRYAVDLLAGVTAGLDYLLKDRVLDPAELVAAVERVADGGSAIDPVMAECSSNRSIANSLFASEKTVEACAGRIFAKLGLEPGPDDHRRVRAVLTYLQGVDES